MNFNSKNEQLGIVTLEILIALGVGVIVISAVMLVSFGNQSVALDTKTANEALYLAQAGLEETRAQAREDLYGVPNSQLVQGIYTRNIFVEDIPGVDFSKIIRSIVTWATDSRSQSTELQTVVADWQLALGGDTCSQTLEGDWTSPQDWKGGYGYADIVSSNGASGLDAFARKVYLASDIKNKSPFYIIDVSDPKPVGLNLPILGSLPSLGYGLTDVSVGGSYAYASAHSTTNAAPQLVVINVSDPTNPVVEKVLDLTPPGDSAYGKTIFYYKQKVYLGLTKSTGSELRIIDVSDPSNPSEIGPGFETNTQINQIRVKDTNAYLATALDNQAWIVDVSDTSNPNQSDPFKQTFIDPSGTQEWSGHSIAFTDTSLYLGRIPRPGSNNDVDLFVLDINDLSLTPDGTLTQTKNSGFSRMVFRSNLLFVSNREPNDGFQIWDVANPASITRYDTNPINIQQTSTAGMDCEGNFIFIGQGSNRALQIIGPGP